MEYAQNSLISSTTGLSLFQCVYDYQLPLFLSLNSNVSCPSAPAYIRHCRRAWTQVRMTLLCSVGCFATQANYHRTPAPAYRVGQRVWLCNQDLLLLVESEPVCEFFSHSESHQPNGSKAPSPKVHDGPPHFPRVQDKPVHKLGPSSSSSMLISVVSVYAVRRLIRWCRMGLYLVAWEGYGPEEKSWFSAGHIPRMVQEFHQQHPNQALRTRRPSYPSSQIKEQSSEPEGVSEPAGGREEGVLAPWFCLAVFSIPVGTSGAVSCGGGCPAYEVA